VATGAASASLSLADAQMPGEETQKKSPLQMMFITATFGLAAATAAFGIIAASVFQIPVVIAAAVVGIADSAYVGVQRVQLNKMDTLRQVMNKLRGEVSRLRGINDELSEENDRLKVQVDKVKDIEEGLSDIVTRQGQSVQSFIQAVKDNQMVLDQMQYLIKAKIMQDLVSIVLRADRDQDSTIDPEEIGMLVLMLKNAQEVTLDEDTFRARMRESGYSTTNVLKLCRTLVHSDEGEDGGIIKVDPKLSHL